MITWNSIWFHFPSTVLMEQIYIIHDYILIILISVFFLPLSVILFSFIFNYFSLNFFENHQLETVWTIAPFFILIFIILPSLVTLYILDSCIFCGITISITGHQWYWSYYLKDLLKRDIDSYIVTDNFSFYRLLEVDYRLLIPTNFPIRFLVSSTDVIHSWTVPRFGVKMDALPGRVNQFCLTRKRSGLFFGQCSEICGANHRFIPIVVESLPISN